VCLCPTSLRTPCFPSTSLLMLFEGHLIANDWLPESHSGFHTLFTHCFALFPHHLTGCQSMFPPRHSLFCNLFSCLCSLQTASGG
jgi:hypothetical protein